MAGSGTAPPTIGIPIITMKLLSGFDLQHNAESVPIAASCQRLLAYLAVWQRPVKRAHVAETLWPDAQSTRAHANLRSSLWRTPAPGRTALIAATSGHLALAEHVRVDYHIIESWAASLFAANRFAEPDHVPVRPSPGAGAGAGTGACGPPGPDGGALPWSWRPASLHAELLPGWDQAWICVERERLRQLVMHCLERLCWLLIAAGRYAEALNVALDVISIEPLRESPHRLAIAVHVREGNAVEAIKAYRSYEQLLRDELGLHPSRAMQSQVAPFLPVRKRVGP
jgi:DNA-binding SARP family transcriptional activator